MRLILGFFLFLFVASGDDFCAVKLRVLHPDGREFSSEELPVMLLDAQGIVVSKTTLSRGQVEFCDFGFGLHSVLIGDRERCGSVEIKNIRYQWMQPQLFVAIKNYCLGEGEGGMSGCSVYFRVIDLDGKPIPYPVAKRAREVAQGTKHGLIPAGMPERMRGEFLISAEGFESGTERVSCIRPAEIERVVTLQRLPKK